jgi:hypothetical protein
MPETKSVRKKPKSNVNSAPQGDDLVGAVRSLRRKVEEGLDQLSLIQGVLEELCERQEALSAWQMEFAKRTVTLGEAQWRALEGLAGQAVFAGFSSKAGAIAALVAEAPSAAGLDAGQAAAQAGRAKIVTSDAEDTFSDSLDEATEFLGDLTEDLSRRRSVRKRVLDERGAARIEDDGSSAAGKSARQAEASDAANGEGKSKGKSKGAAGVANASTEAPESILVVPEKTEFH